LKIDNRNDKCVLDNVATLIEFSNNLSPFDNLIESRILFIMKSYV